MLLITTLFACAAPSADGMTGHLEVDVSQEVPVFLLVDTEGASPEDQATGLSVGKCTELLPADADDNQGATAAAMWDITTEDGLPDSVVYGEAPDGADVVIPAKPLEGGVWYVADIDADGASYDPWSVTFQVGDPDSLLEGYWCEEPSEG